MCEGQLRVFFHVINRKECKKQLKTMLCKQKNIKNKNKKKQDFGWFFFVVFYNKNAFFMIKNDLFFILEQHYVRLILTKLW